MNINENRKLTDTESQKRDEILKGMMSNKKSFINRYGHKKAEEVMLRRATKMAKKQTKDNMDNINLKELVHQALMNPKAPMEEDLNIPTAAKNKLNNFVKSPATMAKVMLAFYKEVAEKENIDFKSSSKMSVALSNLEKLADSKEENIKEDLDIGHEDNEPKSLQSDLMQIANDAIELYQTINSTEGHGEVDFPSWFQSKIIRSKEALQSATQYLNFEKHEPALDALAGDELEAQPTALAENSKHILDFKKKPRALVDLIHVFVKTAVQLNHTFMTKDTADEFLGIFATDTFEDESYGKFPIEKVEEIIYAFTQWNRGSTESVLKDIETTVLRFIQYLYGDKPVRKADQPENQPNRGFSMNEVAGSIAKQLKNK